MNIDDVKIYQIATQLESGVVKLINKFKHNREIIQINQINRSSSSISANIVEGWSRRYYPKDYVRFLTIALGSSDETKHHLKVLYNGECISEFDYLNLYKQYKNLSVRILNLINFIKKKT